MVRVCVALFDGLTSCTQAASRLINVPNVVIGSSLLSCGIGKF
jgi:hypothetical protein